MNGSFRKHETKKQTDRQILAISNWAQTETHPNNIRIATPSRNYQNTVEHVRMGIFTHEILSKINTRRDVEKVLQAYVLEGTVNTHEKETIKDRILSIIENEKYNDYFREGLKVINEKDLMISENGDTAIYRPDRLLETNEGFIIIDFKTGTPMDKHQKQLDTYRQVLETLGKKVIGTEIIYV